MTLWIKICGIRDVSTARAVAKLGPSAIGLNFYKETPRSVSVEAAAKIVEALPVEIQIVGLFVNHSADEILSTCRRCGIRTVQLHGDENPELVADLKNANEDLTIIRAYRVGAEGLAPLDTWLDSLNKLGVKIAACLIDARVKGVYGGSGTTLSWDCLDRDYRRLQWPPLILAGGLTPDNVAEAIMTVQPWGVDVASGVESAPGEKDILAVSRFINAARSATSGLRQEK